MEPGEKHAEMPKSAGDESLARLDKFRFAKGHTPTAALRLKMQMVMQNDAAVFRTGESLSNGQKAIREVFKGVPDIGVTDRGMIWNTDLVETLEFDNLLGQAIVTIDGAAVPTKIACQSGAITVQNAAFGAPWSGGAAPCQWFDVTNLAGDLMNGKSSYTIPAGTNLVSLLRTTDGCPGVVKTFGGAYTCA
jgi:hypothetical protein